MKKIKIITFSIIFALVNITTANASITSSIEITSKYKFSNPPLIEGYLYRDSSDGKIYWNVGGVLYHIQDYGSYQYLFSNPEHYQFEVSNFQQLITLPFPYTGTYPVGIIRGGVDLVNAAGSVYLRFYGQNGIHYKIPNPATMDNYHIRWDSIINVNYVPEINIKPFPLSASYERFPN
ncbi:hypothetical protein [Pedobacter zeae]|uniref:Uncharacterized protein n=1 Tax=Pedobacter zeae TaxID=1737356 RepID=A0A7W6KCK5_9SPHI|nr:hypothetical protein [Pedobacter zeae]MBB4109212.1 hypothetical protein [Pedobacter zeae]GGH10993.1 hypothetical protein GCM10007422_29920 [Pedobacter zeae]